MKVILKKGREKALHNRHPWIFSGAIEAFPSIENGEVLPVYSSSGEFLAKAYFHTQNSISGRVLTFQDESIAEAIERKIAEAILLRKSLFDPEQTNCYRLINAEGDHLPGLIVDIYDDVAVLQINTWGMQRLKSLIVDILQKKLSLRGIFEKSASSARRQEGLEDEIGILCGECPKEVQVIENGILFTVNIKEGQKTGFFLDQKEMRQLIGKLAKNKRVLNCFSYTGGFSIFALKGGAQSVISIDSSQSACQYAIEHTHLNHLPISSHQVMCSDVFDFLSTSQETFDIIILDPPAFAKKRQDVQEALRGYKEINRRAFQLMPAHSYLLTSSCSHFIDEHLFQQMLYQAALESKRNISICSRHIQSPDHPVSLFHPEGSYLKSFLLYIS